MTSQALPMNLRKGRWCWEAEQCSRKKGDWEVLQTVLGNAKFNCLVTRKKLSLLSAVIRCTSKEINNLTSIIKVNKLELF